MKRRVLAFKHEHKEYFLLGKCLRRFQKLALVGNCQSALYRFLGARHTLFFAAQFQKTTVYKGLIGDKRLPHPSLSVLQAPEGLGCSELRRGAAANKTVETMAAEDSFSSWAADHAESLND